MYVGLHRADEDVQCVADFLVILIREKNLQDVLFPGDQLVVIGKVEEGHVGIFLARRDPDRRRRRFLEDSSSVPYIQTRQPKLSCQVFDDVYEAYDTHDILEQTAVVDFDHRIRVDTKGKDYYGVFDENQHRRYHSYSQQDFIGDYFPVKTLRVLAQI